MADSFENIGFLAEKIVDGEASVEPFLTEEFFEVLLVIQPTHADVALILKFTSGFVRRVPRKLIKRLIVHSTINNSSRKGLF